MIVLDEHRTLDVHSIGTTAPEFADFQDEPRQMRSGSVGKAGFLKLDFERRDKRTILAAAHRRIPYMAQRALYCDEEMPELAHVFVITTTGCVLQGDRLALDISLGTGAQAHVTTQSATKNHSMDANYAAQTRAFDSKRARTWNLFQSRSSRTAPLAFSATRRSSVAPSASVVMCEVVQPGRKHHREDEWFGATMLSLATTVCRPGGKLLFKENLS